jgi:hypothetical protein
VNFGRFFVKQVRPNDFGDIFQKKMRPNGEILPNLVTLPTAFKSGSLQTYVATRGRRSTIHFLNKIMFPT